MEDIIVGIDIGTTKVCTLIGKVNRTGQMEIYGKGCIPCDSVKKGVIIDIEAVSKAIRHSVEQAENSSGMRIGSAYVNIYGTHVSVLNHIDSIEVSSENRLITTNELDRLYNQIEHISIPEGSQIIDIIPRQYVIDGYDGIKDPLGMSGLNLEIDADIVVGKLTSVQNIIKSVEKAGLEVDGIIIESFATSELALTSEEKEMGVVLIDVGGGITDVSAFKNGKVLMYDSIPVGGDHITNDISIGLHISYSEAEKIKKQYELALTTLIKNDQEISVYDVNDEITRNIKVSQVI
ncbi:MAG TPA: cell division protein FtsA [Clostridiales bacterium]|nr:cell division protein FtsA [Clostridiales bacterium]